MSELDWAGGLFEADGCFAIARRKTQSHAPQLFAILSMTDEDDVRRFREAVDLGNINGPYKRTLASGRQAKLQWRWQVGTFEQFQAVVCMLWNGLGARRRETARRLLEGAR